MESQEALKKLIPMSEDEIDELMRSDIKITAPTLAETPINLMSPTKSIYGDFSMNSFVVVDAQETQAKSDCTNVYMESVVDLFRSLNAKVETLCLERSREKTALEKIRSHLSVEDVKGARDVINSLKRAEPEMNYLYESLIYKKLPDILIGIRQELVTVKETLFLLRNCYNDIEGKFIKKAEETERLQNLISQQSKDHKTQVESLISESNGIKDQLVEIYKEYSGGTPESLLTEDVVEETKKLVREQAKLIKELREEIIRKDETIGRFERKASLFDVTHLTSQVESLKETQRKLQDENLNLTQIVNKLSEKNTKLKQELIFFNGELKKSVEMLARKNETITRQKTLIELFQEKIGGGTAFPIEDLRKKKQEIEERLEKENDYFEKQKLRKEKEDCTKRLSDFLTLQMNKRDK